MYVYTYKIISDLGRLRAMNDGLWVRSFVRSSSS